ncbi:unnamed protein product [Bathycoccus prasinos]|jgi:predicted RNA-binding protein with RPS1 domain|tara:strand:+ start:104 stop:1381 length:1278 start_codon:yes stop_codon:yes gene_type:complete
MSSSLALSFTLCLGQHGRGAKGKVSATNTAKRWPVSEVKRRVWSSKSASSSRPSSSSKSSVYAFSEETEETEETKSAAEVPTDEGAEKARNQTSKNESGDKENALKRDLMKALESGKKVTGKVEAMNRGGLILRVMKNKYRAFLPKSQMRSSRLKFCKTTKAELTEAEVMKQQIGNLIDVKFVEVTPKRVVCSEKSLIQENAEKKLPVGTQQRVVVTNLSDFGAFVEVINNDNSSSQEQLLSPVGLEGLIHISELSWNKVAHPRDVCRVGDELEVKVLEVANSGQRVNFSAKQMLDDPLMETLDTIMPVTMPELSFDDSDSAFASGDFDGEEGTKMEASLPGLPRICAELLSEDGVEAVIPGRTAVERRVVSQDLELWLTNVQVEDGYNLLARSGRQVQEIHVVTSLNREAIKRAIKRATRATNA